MPKRALADKRPFLLLSVLAALAFYYMRWTAFPELYLLPLKGAAAGLLAVYAFVRHRSNDAKMMGWALGAAALGDIALEIDFQIAGLLFFVFHVMAMGLFLQHRRADLAPSQTWVCGLTLLLTPVVAYLLPADRDAAWSVALYGLALGAMAASAWASSFPRYRVGAGAMLFVASNVLIFAEMGPLEGEFLPQVVIWPVYYLGIFLICTGVIQTLRKREPQLRVVSSREG